MGCDYYVDRIYTIQYKYDGITDSIKIEICYDRRFIYINEDSDIGYDETLEKEIKRNTYVKNIELTSNKHKELLFSIRNEIIKKHHDSLKNPKPSRVYPISEKYSTITESDIQTHEKLEKLVYDNKSRIRSQIGKKIEDDIITINYDLDVEILSNTLNQDAYKRE